MAKKASLDIETTGLEPAGVAVLSVGIVMFDDVLIYDQVAEVGFWRMDPAWAPGRRDRGTWEWWQKQSPEAINEAFKGKQMPWDFAVEFSNYVQANDPDEVWCNPARFDLGHLRELFHQLGIPFPIDYRKERDLPTLKSAARGVAARRGAAELDELNAEIRRIQNSNTHEHSALHDAIEQARQIKFLTEYLRS
jgi:DNA polymerase III epsilon subunit-like protein